MAETDAASEAFAAEARRATGQAENKLAVLEALVKGLDFTEEAHVLTALRANFDRYRALDRDVLALAVENTNLKAQRLSFGVAHEAADRIQAALQPLARTTSRSESALATAVLALRATLSVREIEVLHAPHIAAMDDTVMNELEQKMAELKTEAHVQVALLVQSKEPESRAASLAAQQALASFDAAHDEIVKLSRRNSNLRSLALSLGEKLSLVSSCHSKLDELSALLDKRLSPATR